MLQNFMFFTKIYFIAKHVFKTFWSVILNKLSFMKADLKDSDKERGEFGECHEYEDS